MQPHVAVAHFPFELGLRDKGGDGIDDYEIDSPGADKRTRNLERLLAMIRLRDDQIVDIDAKLASILRIQGMLRRR